MPRTSERCSFLFGCELGDPVSAVYLNDHGCLAGTMLGKVWMYSSDTRKVETLTEFSDEAVRGLYLDEDGGFATLGETCKGWRRTHPHVQTGTTNFRSLDKKNTQSVRHVLQRGSWACVLFPISTTVVNVTRQEYHHRHFKLFDYGGAGSASDIAPCDFDGESLVVVDRTTTGAGSVFRVVHLERNECAEVDDLPRGNSVSLVNLWGPSSIICVAGSSLYIYDYAKRQVVRWLTGHRAEVVACDAQDPELIVTMSADATVKLWVGATGVCRHTFHIPEASYFLGYPYCLAMHDKKILASADEGVFLIEHGDE